MMAMASDASVSDTALTQSSTTPSILAPSSASLVWTVFFAVSAAGYGGIWRDTGRYREIPEDTGRYREIRDTGGYGAFPGGFGRVPDRRGP